MSVCVHASAFGVFTFGLGGHFERCRALALAVAVVGHNPEAIFGVWHEVLDGDLHLPGTTGVDYSLPDVNTHKQVFIGGLLMYHTLLVTSSH